MKRLSCTRDFLSRENYINPFINTLTHFADAKVASLTRSLIAASIVSYALTQWAGIKVFCADSAIRVDNNISELGMKRVVLNRKNSLFAGKSAWWQDVGDPD
ncbi:MAG: transposase [Terracidiphilus sp.]|jgi:hypothetical protein